MFENAVSRLKAIKLINLLWLSLVLSEIFTGIMNTIMGLIWWGRIDIDLLLIGSVDAFVVAMIVTAIILLIFNEMTASEIRAAEALRESEDNYRTLLAHSPGTLYACNTFENYAPTYISPNVEAQLGYRPEEFTSDPDFWAERIHPEDRQRVFDNLAHLFESDTYNHEYRFMRKDGTYRWMHDEMNLLRDAQGEPSKISGYWNDITERKQYEEKLIAARQELSEAQRIAHLGNWEMDLQTGTGKWSDESFRIFGFEPGAIEPTFNNFMELVHTDDRKIIEAYYHDILSGTLSQCEFNVRIIRPSREERVIHDKLEVISDKDGKAVKLIGINFDITERKQMEEAINKSNEELELRVIERTNELKSAYENMRKLAAHLQTIQEEERKRIACDIHDELGQILLGLNMDLTWFRDKYGDHKPIFDKADSMLHTLKATIQSVKRICTELRPSLLDDFGLIAAIEWQANEYEKRTGNKCTVIEEPQKIELDKELSTVLYRVFQESLTNIMKHASATKVEVRLVKDNNQVILEIADNGKGIIDAELERPQSFGLIGMRERVYPFGGEMKITGTVGGGTTIQIILPLSVKDS